MITLEQVLALAPDAAARKAARELAPVRKWKALGQSERAVWGEHQGSGKEPYQTRVDLRGTAFKCTCPSRKLPCKHALGLLLALVETPASISNTAEPGWVSAWLEDREARAEQKARKAESASPAVADAGAKQRRAAQRAGRVEDGMAELGLWLRDLVREGFAAVARHPVSFFESTAARLVDAQAPGAARLVRIMGSIAKSGDDVHRRLLAQAARLHLLVEGYRRLETLPVPTQADIRSALGFTLSSDEVLRGESVSGCWRVLGRRIETEDRLRLARTWLWNADRGVPALVLAFAAGKLPLELTDGVGTERDADLAFFPGSVPLRALEKSRQSAPRPLTSFSGSDSVGDAVRRAARAFSINPWLERLPLLLRAVTLTPVAAKWFVRDAAGSALPIAARWPRAWELLAAGGGRPVHLAGEWDGRELWPLSAWSEGWFCDLAGETTA